MARDEIQKQSAGSKKRYRKYKEIIKNGELCLMISIEITQEEYEMGRGFLGERIINAVKPEFG